MTTHFAPAMLLAQLSTRETAMGNRLLVINGHPDPKPQRFCAALSDAYVDGARSHGYDVERIDAGALLPKMPAGGLARRVPGEIAAAAELANASDRLAVVFPLWLGAPPVPLLRLLEQMFRIWGPIPEKTATRVIVTMDMPALLYRPAGGVPSAVPALSPLVRLPGIHVAERTMIGSVATIALAQRLRWLEEVRNLAQADFASDTGRRGIFGWQRSA